MLLKDLSPEQGFVFYSNHDSRKGRELAANPACSLLFGWYAQHRQVRVEGRATPVPRTQTEEYFASRPRDSQLGAWASPQSEVVAGRAALEDRFAEVTERFDGARSRPRRTGAGTPCCPTPWSSGRAGPAGCTTGCATCGPVRGWRVERLAP